MFQRRPTTTWRRSPARAAALMVGPHVSNFDMAALSIAARGVKMSALAFALPPSGYSLQNEVRLAGGIDIMPIDVSALRKALGVLKRGGLVATAVDRPDPFGGGEMLPFFGREARLPVGHVRLALQTNSPILVSSCEYRPTDHVYMVHISRWIEMERTGDRRRTCATTPCGCSTASNAWSRAPGAMADVLPGLGRRFVSA
ncbi:MAG: lysophospholipid acyltransferase family protein [Caldilineales bacterium]